MVVSLVDAFTRHQVYLEGYKDGLDDWLDPVLMGIYDDLRAALVAARFDRLNELTRKRLNKLIRTIQRLQLGRNDKFRADMLKELRTFASQDAVLSRDIMQHIEGKTVEDAYEARDGLPLLGLLALQRNRAGRIRLWALVSESIDPASGLTPVGLIKQYTDFLARNVRDLIRRGHANGWTVKQIMAEIFGTPSRRFRDGFIDRARRAGSSMIHTAIQHVSSVVQAGVASVFYRNYEWVAVLDANTSKICRTRDGKIYEYRKGPLPPAHFNCRSRAVPVSKGASYDGVPDTFYSWLKLQPAAVQNDFLGKTLARGLRSGRVNSEGLGRFRTRKRLTLEDFLGKFNIIILT